MASVTRPMRNMVEFDINELHQYIVGVSLKIFPNRDYHCNLSIVFPHGRFINCTISGGSTYPFEIPKLVDHSFKYLHIASFHMNYKGECCVEVPFHIWKNAQIGLRLNKYIEYYVIPFYANLQFKLIAGYYPYGDWAHGDEGLKESVLAKIKNSKETDLKSAMAHFLQFRSRVYKIPCFCGASTSHNCHRRLFQEIELLDELERLTILRLA